MCLRSAGADVACNIGRMRDGVFPVDKTFFGQDIPERII